MKDKSKSSQISKVKFKLVVPSFNSPDWIEKCLASIESQTYAEVEVCVIDDASTLPGQREIIDIFCHRNGWKKIFNSTNLGSLHNIVNGIAELKCRDSDVIVIVDGDDWLHDSHVLEKVSEAYKQDDIYLTYGNYVTYPASFTGNPSELAEEVIVNKQFRNHAFIFTHLKTFKYILWGHIKDADLHDEEGNYFRAGGDAAIMLPMLEMAGRRFRPINEILYVYNISNPLNDFKLVPDEVADVIELLRRRPVYDTLIDEI